MSTYFMNYLTVAGSLDPRQDRRRILRWLDDRILVDDVWLCYAKGEIRIDFDSIGEIEEEGLRLLSGDFPGLRFRLVSFQDTYGCTILECVNGSCIVHEEKGEESFRSRPVKSAERHTPRWDAILHVTNLSHQRRDFIQCLRRSKLCEGRIWFCSGLTWRCDLKPGEELVRFASTSSPAVVCELMQAMLPGVGIADCGSRASV